MQRGQKPPEGTLRRQPQHLQDAAALPAVAERVWEAAHVGLSVVTLDTDTTVHTLFGNQMGGRKSYNPKNKGKKSYQPLLTFLAETREYVSCALRNWDRPTGHRLPGIWSACLPPC